MQCTRFLLSLVCLLATCHLHAAIEWQTDYKQARQLAQLNPKPTLLFFNGSDWSGWAMKMKHEILDSPAFQNAIAEKFICMEVDFPEHTALDEKLVQQNQALKQRFAVQQLPALILMDAHERLIAQLGYLPETGEQLAHDLLKLVEQDAYLMKGLQNLSAAAPKELQKLYQLAFELGRQSAIQNILAAGLKTNHPFFYLEKYRLLVSSGKIQTPEARDLRRKLFAMDPENQQEVHFTVALIDFQELSQKENEPEVAAQPLIDYLAQFGQKDSQNVWRLEMMIAQLFVEADRWDEALDHAEKAYRTAPKEMTSEIAHSVDCIRSARS